MFKREVSPIACGICNWDAQSIGFRQYVDINILYAALVTQVSISLAVFQGSTCTSSLSLSLSLSSFSLRKWWH